MGGFVSYPRLYEILAYAVTEKGKPGAPLQKLSSVSLNTDGGQLLSIKELLPFLKLDTVTTVSAHRLLDEMDKECVFIYDSQSKINDLSLIKNSMNSHSLSCLLYCCPYLRRFTYDSGNDDMGREFVDPAIASGLLASKESLEEIVLSNDLACEASRWYPVSPLASFPKLRIIDADFVNFIRLNHKMAEYSEDDSEGDSEDDYDGEVFTFDHIEEEISWFADLMPESLEHLVVRDCSDAIFDGVADLLDRGHATSLKTIELKFDEYATMDSHDRYGEYWEGRAKEEGIVLTRVRGNAMPVLEMASLGLD
ncbi:uncharacterized protein LY89DRAFT_666856 [Mollisia scopiformis]|uniref:Uncharacterized protein n=1 Tax=Mollisia scopiformis TaxID=149040 RepID=A0A194XIP1_MOLSC|nr:uncharacterized protein LY89DRAFT_666856 [Mollisia scopiformis]KUJ20028.1 hypothetical protein LY89DRAFT_666856 [Mollisia scopiformis]